MGLYVEVMCDIRREGQNPKDILRPICWSDENASPQGPTIAEARKDARNQKWIIGPGARAICPGCALALKGEGTPQAAPLDNRLIVGYKIDLHNEDTRT